MILLNLVCSVSFNLPLQCKPIHMSNYFTNLEIFTICRYDKLSNREHFSSQYGHFSCLPPECCCTVASSTMEQLLSLSAKSPPRNVRRDRNFQTLSPDWGNICSDRKFKNTLNSLFPTVFIWLQIFIRIIMA